MKLEKKRSEIDEKKVRIYLEMLLQKKTLKKFAKKLLITLKIASLGIFSSHTVTSASNEMVERGL